MTSAPPAPAARPGPAIGPTEGAALLVGFAVLGSVFFERQAPLFVVQEIGDRFGIDPALHGTLTLGVGIGWAAGMLLARWSSGRWSNRRRLVVGLGGTMAGCLLVAVAPAWWVVVAGQAVSCFFAGSSTPAMMSVVYGAASPARRGFAAGTVLSAGRVGGSLLAPIAMTLLTVHVGWRAGMAVGAVLLAGTALAVRALVPDVAPDRPPAGARRSRPPALRYHPGGRRNLAISAFNCAALVAWVTAVSQFGGPLLGEWFGSGTAVAGAILGSFGVGSAVAAFAVPVWSDRIGRRAGQAVTMVVGASSGLAIVVLATAGVGTAPLALVLLGLGGCAMGGLPMALSLIPAEAVAVGDPGRAMVVPALVAELAGGALVPAVVAAVATTAGPASAVAITAAILAVGAVASAFIVPVPGARSAGAPPSPVEPVA